MGQFFQEIDKKFGFGLMRLPMKGEEVDLEQCNVMVDKFMQAGFTYFDTAKGYLSGMSEVALRECVVKRYPRDSFTVTDKLTQNYFQSEEDIYNCFAAQLETCGVDYFDFYLMHAQGRSNYEQYQKYHAYEIAQELKRQGKVHHVGISFHDTAAFLDKILTEHPELELVQIQLNYIDYEDPGVQSRKCLEVCRKHHKPVVVMEPVRGGRLVNLPDEADKILRDAGDGSNASYALRFAAGFDDVCMVLSGMSDVAQMEDNLRHMSDFKPLDEKEQEAVQKVSAILQAQRLVPCTACRYCTDGCPKHILIPDLFADYNAKLQHKDWNSSFYYHNVHTKTNGKAKDCIACGKCEQVCPQHLPIRRLLRRISSIFDTE